MGSRLAGKVCLITGGGRGLGREIAVAYACEGAKTVAITYTAGREHAERTAADIAECGSKPLVVEMDVRSRPSINAGVRRLMDAEGRIDVLVNNAGINRQGPINTVTEKDWD